MDSGKSGQNVNPATNDLQRRAAADIARRKVLAAYTKSVQQSFQDHTDNAGSLKEKKVNPEINSESWKRYHTAWQDYYQKYYSEYYSNAARNYIEKERLKDAREKEEEKEALAAITKNENTETESRLRATIRQKATESVKSSHRKRHYIPIVAGILVALFILFLQYNRLIFAPLMAYVSPGNVPASEIEAIDPTVTKTVSADPKLIIPKLNVDVPVHFGIPLSEVYNAMANGVAHYRVAGASAFPGEIGNLVIGGHSAGDIYSSNPYKYIFSGLERLSTGDLIYVNYESTRYTYRVTGSKVVDPTDVASLIIDTDKPLITLFTCTPLGTSKYRLLIFGEQISPATDNAQESSKIEETPETENLPANEPSFFEGIWNWLTGN